MARPHIAALVEDAFSTRVNRVLERRGWQERVIGFTAFGTPERVRVLGRVLMTQDKADEHEAGADAGASDQELDEAFLTQRGWRSFLTLQAVNSAVTVRVGEVSVVVHSDRGGYIDAIVTEHGLPPGWHELELESHASGDTVRAAVQVIDPSHGYGIVSDIDDTVMVTHLPRILIAGWNTFVRSEQAREVVPGMPQLFRELQQELPDTPVFYLSTGAWNTAPTLERFLRRNDYPRGVLLLTDWGPTNTGWFRSGQDHKRRELHRLMREFPGLTWLLIGDDGQHDPTIYGEFATFHPEVVEVVALRQLTPTQQVLSHGFPVANERILGKQYDGVGVPEVRAPDGFSLLRLIKRARAHLASADTAAAKPGPAGRAEPMDLGAVGEASDNADRSVADRPQPAAAPDTAAGTEGGPRHA